MRPHRNLLNLSSKIRALHSGQKRVGSWPELGSRARLETQGSGRFASESPRRIILKEGRHG
jgi:hypothetical protein